MADPSGGREMVMREYRKGNWTVSETLVLIEAKKMDDERRVRRSEKQTSGAPVEVDRGIEDIRRTAVGNGNGSQILRVCQQSLGFVAPMMAQPMHQIPSTIVLSYPPPQPQSLSLSLPPPPQPPPSSSFHVEPIQPTVDTSPGKRRRATPGETTAGGEREAAEEVAIGAALSRCASVITQVIRESEERQERRHKEVVKLQERRLRPSPMWVGDTLKIEKSKAKINRQGISGLVDAINQLATSILALASSSCHNNHNHQGGPP
ncbi:unnamed protein product [Arabidopsis halleri]